MSTDRRSFLGKSIALGAGIILAPGITLHNIGRAEASNLAASSSIRWGLLINTNLCTPECTACVDACKIENGLQGSGRPKTDAQWIRKLALSDPDTGLKRSLPVMCQHCEDPPCVDVCPTGASFKRDDGIVLVDKHTCIGCRYCMIACPYKARSFVHEDLTDQKPDTPRGKGTVESCTLCVHRIDAGGQPACVEACHTKGNGAMIFGNLNNPASEISQKLEAYGGTKIRADLVLNPSVQYQGL